MEAKPYSPNNYPIIRSWWESYKWAPIPEDLLPQTGYIIWQELQPLVSGFVYMTDSKFGVLEWVLANPESDTIKRREALDLLITTLVSAAKEKGCTCLFTTAEHPGLIERYKTHGFTVGDVNMTNLIRRID